MSADDQPPERLRQLDQDQHSARIVRQKIWRQMNVENQHFMAAIVGREGTGKSHSALSLCRTVDPEFSSDDVFFNPEDLLEAFDSDQYGAGNMIVLDEAGVGLGNRSWYNKEQILLNQTLQTVRDDNMGVIFTLPRLEELDSQTIGRLHSLIQMEETYPDRGWALSRWKNIVMTRDNSGKEFQKYPRLRVDGVKKRITRFGISAPPEELVDEYEQGKEAFKEQLYEEAMAAYDGDDDGDEEADPTDIADSIISDGVSDVVSEHGQNETLYVDKDIIRVQYDLSHRDAAAVKKLVERQADL